MHARARQTSLSALVAATLVVGLGGTAFAQSNEVPVNNVAVYERQ